MQQIEKQKKFETEKNTTIQTLVELLKEFYGSERSKKQETEWFKFCIESKPSKSLIYNHGISGSVTLAQIVADVFKKFLEINCDASCFITKPADIAAIKNHASTIKDKLTQIHPSILPCEHENIIECIDLLKEWKPTNTAIFSKKGDTGRIWFSQQLAIAIAKTFSKIPTDYIHSLILTFWPETNIRVIARYFEGHKKENILLEAKRIREHENEKITAQQFTNNTINKAKKPTRPLTEESKKKIEDYEHRINNLKQEKKEFSTDGERLRAIEKIFSDMDDQEQASAHIHNLKITAKDFDQSY